MKARTPEGFRQRVLLGLAAIMTYLLLVPGVAIVMLARSHAFLKTETTQRARAATRAVLDATGPSLRSSLTDWARGAAPRRPAIPPDMAQRLGIVSAELLAPTGWSIGARAGAPAEEAVAAFTEAQQRRLAAGETLLDTSGLSGPSAYAAITVEQPVFGDDGRFLGVLRVEVGAESLALSRRQLRGTAAILGGSVLAFAGLLALFTRWSLRPLALLDEARQGDDAPVEALARADDTGFAVETYRKMIEQLREKETELRRLRELERHRADELQELNASIVDSMLSGMIVLDLSGKVSSMNGPARRLLLGDRDERTTGRPFAEVARDAPELVSRVDACLTRGEAIARDEVRLHLPGIGRCDLGVSVAPLRGSEGEQRGALALLVDLTEVKQLQEDMRLRENMADLGELSAGIAHEFRNSLATIQGFARLIEKHGEADSREHAAAIAAECGALRRVVDDFLRFANPTRLVIEPVDLAAIFASLADDVRSRAGAKSVSYTVQEGLPTIQGDETLLRRAFTNLVRNACDAVADGGRIAVSCETAARGITVRVDDDGPGIPPEERQRVFVPFFTRKDHGTGLGLALVRKVILHHGGRIVVEDSPWGGARLSVSLPVRPT